jgi:ribose 5-phosphate isomerase A
VSDDRKRAAAHAALQYLPESGVLGLGSGSTSKLFIDAVGELVKAGRRFVGVPTSEQSRSQARALGIELLEDEGPWQIDVCVDGADEVSAELDLIKGGGGCHTREKIVNLAARKNIIIVDDSKLSQRLGQRWPVPVEVVQFGHLATVQALARWGTATLRLRDGAPWVTDSGNLIYDLRVGEIAEPARLQAELRSVPGVVETGLFVGRADVVLVASESGTRVLSR